MSPSIGIQVGSNKGVVTHINNAVGGVIRGGMASIYSVYSSGGVSLVNHGTLDGAFVGEPSHGADQIANPGKIHGQVHLGGGDDLFNGKGGTSGAVFGEAGNDRIIGGKSNDHLSGGAGSDTLTGGPGHDHFVFDAALNPATNVDRITDFVHGLDRIDLSHAVFGAVNLPAALHAGMFFAGAHAHDPDDRIIYNPGNGWLSYDADGNHPGAAIHFATLAPHLALAAADFVVVA
jgi:Ca2+-binding RTX toxin-like protein